MLHNDLRNQLWRMPIDERCAMLVCSIIEADHADPLRVALQVTRLTRQLAEPLSEADRYRVSNALRDLADVLERRGAVVRV